MWAFKKSHEYEAAMIIIETIMPYTFSAINAAPPLFDSLLGYMKMTDHRKAVKS